MNSGKIKVYMSSIWLLVSLSGCSVFSNIAPKRASKLGDNESIIVIGIPETHQVVIGRGREDGDNWLVGSHKEVRREHRWDNGYLIRKVKSLPAGQGLGVLRIISQEDGISEFRPCKGKSTLVFKIPPGKILYVGHVALDSTKDKGGIYRDDLEAAKAHMQNFYPAIAPQLTMADTEIKELSNVNCNFSLADFWGI